MKAPDRKAGRHRAASDVRFEEDARRGYHADRTNVRGVFLFLVILLVAVVVIHVGVWQMTRLYGRRQPVREFVSPPETTLGALGIPHWVDPEGDLAAQRALEERNLSGYSWIDRERGIVRVPIERAMELLAGASWPIVDGPLPAELPDAYPDTAPDFRSGGPAEERGDPR